MRVADHLYDAVPPPPSCPTASPAGDGPRLSATGWFLSSHWRRRAREQIHLARVSTVTRIYLRSRNVPRRQGFLDAYNDERRGSGAAAHYQQNPTEARPTAGASPPQSPAVACSA